MHCNVVFKNTKQIKTPAFHLPFFPLVTCSPLPEVFLLEKPTHNLTAREGFLLYPLNRGSYSLDAVTPHRAHSLCFERWKGSGGPHNDQSCICLLTSSASSVELGSQCNTSWIFSRPSTLRIPRPSCVHSHSDVVAYVFNCLSYLCFCVSMTSTHLWAISPYPIHLRPPAYIDISFLFLSILFSYSSKTILPHRLFMTRTEKERSHKKRGR